MNVRIIRKLVMSLALVVAVVGFLTLHAAAIPISGTIQFSGVADLTPNPIPFATDISFESGSVVLSAPAPTGDYSGLGGTLATFPSSSFSLSVGTSILTLWTLTSGGGFTYSLENALITGSVQTPGPFLNLTGTGTATTNFPGLDSTPGTWSLTSTSDGAQIAFSSTTTVVPEPATMLLLGSGLIGMGVYARRRFTKK